MIQSSLKRLLDRSRLKPVILLLPLYALTVFALTLIIQKRTATNESDSCKTILHHGQWLRNSTKSDPSIWQPQDCTMHNYDTSDIAQCMPPNTQILFLGDSTARKAFWAMANLLDSGIRDDSNVHTNIHFDRHNISIHMLWDPYLNSSDSFGSVQKIANTSERAGKAQILYVTTGLWHAMFEPRDRVMEGYKQSVDSIVSVLRNQLPGAFRTVYFGPTQLPQFELLDRTRNTKITRQYIDEMHAYTDNIFGYNSNEPGTRRGNEGILYTHENRIAAYYAPVFNRYGPGHDSVYDGVGIHYRQPVTSVQAQTFLNHHCNKLIMNPETFPHSATCCMPYSQPTSAHLIMAILVVALSASLTILVFVPIERLSALTPETLKWVISIIVATGLCTLYAFFCDRTYLFNKQYNVLSWYEFFALSQAFLVAIGLSVTRTGPLSHGFTSLAGQHVIITEWKGLAIGLWLLTKLTGLHNEYYVGELFTRILEASLIFSETYGFALATMCGNVGVVRLVTSLARINAFAILLSWTLGTSYYFYSLPFKISFWYIFVFTGYGILNGSWISVLATKILRRESSSHQSNAVHDLVKLLILTSAFGIGVIPLWTTLSQKLLQYPVDLRDEFWVGIAAVMSSAVMTNSPLASQIAKLVQPFRFLMLLIAGLGSCFLINLCLFSGSFVSPEQYTRGFHQFATLGFVAMYTIFRCFLLGYKDSSVLYSDVLEFLGSSWLELFVFSYHSYLAGDGTIRLYIFTTGTTDDTPFQLTIRRMFNFLILTGLLTFLAHRISSAWEGLEGITSGSGFTRKETSNLVLSFDVDMSKTQDKICHSSVALLSPDSSSSSSSTCSETEVYEISEDELNEKV